MLSELPTVPGPVTVIEPGGKLPTRLAGAGLSICSWTSPGRVEPSPDATLPEIDHGGHSCAARGEAAVIIAAARSDARARRRRSAVVRVSRKRGGIRGLQEGDGRGRVVARVGRAGRTARVERGAVEAVDSAVSVGVGEGGRRPEDRLVGVQDPVAVNVARFLTAMGEPTEVPRRSPGRGPPYWKSRVLRRQVLGDEDDGQGCWVPQTA